jgi:YbgC/YbaW family acyl-CoA thioester hydrolase
LDEYRFTTPYVVRIADINYARHVSNAAVLNFFQDARIAYFTNLGPFSELDLGEGCGIVLPEAHVRYLAEMFLGDVLEIGVRGDELREKSFRLSYRIERQGQPTAEGTTPIVCFDYRERKARPLPAALRKAITRFEGLG